MPHSKAPDSSSWWTHLIGALGILLAGLICYGPALQGEVLWDDPAHVTSPDLRTAEGLGRIWTDVLATQQYYPVLHSVFWLEHQIWGDAVLGYHLANVIQHALACTLFALLLIRLQRPDRGGVDEPDTTTTGPTRPTVCIVAWLGGLLMAVHPVAVESVAWISEQKNTLSTVFYFAAALAYFRYREHRGLGRYLCATGLFMLALGSKTVTSTLPAALLVILWWRHGRLKWRRDVAPLAPWFGLSLAAGLGTAWIERNLIGADGAEYSLNLIERVLLASRIVWFYLQSVVWPFDLAFFYERWDVPALAGSWWPFLVAALIVTGACWAIRQRCRGALATWLLWVGTLFPALGFFNVFPFAFSYVADHFQYLATFAVIGGLAGGLTRLADRLPSRTAQAIPATLGLVSVALIPFSRAESRHYQSNVALFSASVAAVPENWMAQRCLAWALAKLPDREVDAIHHYRESLRLKPDSPDSANGLGVLLLNDPATAEEGIALLRRAIELRPHFAEPHFTLARLLRDQPDRLPEMIAHLEVALETKPRFAAAHLLLGETLSRLPERQSEALHHFNEALRWDDTLAGAHVGIGQLLASLPGRAAEAEARFRQALALNPENPAAHFELGTLLSNRPETAAEAETHLKAAIRLEPDAASAHFNLANLLGRQPRRAAESLPFYETALRLEPNSAAIHGNLGNALGQLGRPAEAIDQYQQALALDPGLGWIHQNLALALAPLSTRTEQALFHAREAVRLSPRSAPAYNTLAIVHAQQGALREARDAWQRVLELDPNFAPARENLARVNQLLNR